MVMGARVSVPTQSLAEAFFTATDQDTDLLPPVTRYVSPDYRSFIIERSPTMQRIKAKNGVLDSEREYKEFEIPIPWMYYAIAFSDDQHQELAEFRIYCRTEQIYHPDEVLAYLPLPNCYSWGEVCLGENYIEEALHDARDGNLSSKINALITAFWGSGFNLDTIEFAEAGKTPDALAEAMKNRDNPELEYRDYNDSSKILDYFENWSKMSMEELLSLEFYQAKVSVISPDNGNYTTEVEHNSISSIIRRWASSRQIGWTSGETPFLDYMRNLVVRIPTQ